MISKAAIEIHRHTGGLENAYALIHKDKTNSPPHRWLRKGCHAGLISIVDSPLHRWLRKNQT
ncbi:hypothetical protein [uncultured Gammaproteobacteria bacterium]|nr:hypothetical protein [uncultured Gammaproteobacteria bacterium]